MNAPRTARARARVELTYEIVASARAQLATVGPQALSLRAIARDLGMVSSAIYRYFRNRDDLLTAVLLDAYWELGSHAQMAHDTARESGKSHRDTWMAVWAEVRTWSLAHRHEFALLYGTPVPDYAAPPETTAEASRTPLSLVQIANDAARAEQLTTIPTTSTVDVVTDDIRRLTGQSLPDGNLIALLNAWTLMIGTITFELFGHYNGVIDDPATFYRQTADSAATSVGLP